MAIAAATLGIIGVPTAAMACIAPQGPGATKNVAGVTRNVGNQSTHPSSSRPLPGTPVPSWTDSAADPTGGTQPTAKTTHTPHKRKPTGMTKPPTATTPTQPAPIRPTHPVGKPTTEASKPPAPTKPTTEASKPPAPTKPTTPVDTQKPTTPAAPPSGPAAEVVSLVNQERAKAGCPALTVNTKLTAAALQHSQDMAAHANMSHTGSDGSGPGERITRAGYIWTTYGENVAYGYSTPQLVMTGWMNSPGHRQNILNCSFKEIGVGLAGPNSYWTQDFGTAR
ncbi:CAP domain-containing protein [Embleya scabrispora]|uniref:CAP domain-containing protein n=1 Tax=Embleya scabrispora TaxID=159449 RepID=UPI000365EBDA|nr:CAP domain-containing protein [Embleya scabrispora]